MFSAIRARLARRQPEDAPAHGAPQWAAAAGDEFANLSEAERCDLIFAFAALEDTHSQQMLERALDDPSEAVAVAAARAIVKSGRSAALERYLEDHPGERSRRIAATVELLG